MNAFAEENAVITFGKTKPRMKLFLILATIFLLVTTVVFIALFVHYYIKYNNDDPQTDDSVCTTPVCVSTAARLLKKMNLSVDPCVDFNEFACGRFNREDREDREASFSEGHEITVKMFKEVEQEIILVMKDIIKEDIKAGQPKHLEKMKIFYRSCMDTGKIEETPLETILNETYRKDWPTLNPAWSNSSFNLNELIVRYSREYTEPLFDIDVGPHPMNSTVNIIYLMKPTSRSQKQDVLSEAAIVLGANRTTAEQDAKEFLELREALFKTENEGGNTQQLNESELAITIKLGKISENYPWIDVSGVMKAVFGTVNITLSDDDDIYHNSVYMEHLHSVLKNFSSRAIQNYFGFTYALPRVKDMRYRLREKTNIEKPRWEVCLKKSSTYFSNAMSKQFVARKFSNETKASVQKMIDNLKEAFKQILGEITWMESSTKTAALKKLAAMTSKIGYPDTHFTDEDINQEYEQLDMDESAYYRNERLIHSQTPKNVLATLRKPFDKTKWHDMTPIVVNAEYNHNQNSMTFTAAILQPPNFSPTFPDALNYGSIGTVIGHEITHGFGNRGSQYNDEGNLAVWWQPSDGKIFLDKVQCIVDQASKFKFDEVNMIVNGELVLGETIADNGGLKESYRAYKALVVKKGEDKILPGLKLKYDQLFFLAFAQNWCEGVSPEDLKWKLKNVHPPGRFRLIGTLQNSEEFAKAFNCPLGSYMNPVKKCSLW